MHEIGILNNSTFLYKGGGVCHLHHWLPSPPPTTPFSFILDPFHLHPFYLHPLPLLPPPNTPYISTPFTSNNPFHFHRWPLSLPTTFTSTHTLFILDPFHTASPSPPPTRLSSLTPFTAHHFHLHPHAFHPWPLSHPPLSPPPFILDPFHRRSLSPLSTRLSSLTPFTPTLFTSTHHLLCLTSFHPHHFHLYPQAFHSWTLSHPPFSPPPTTSFIPTLHPPPYSPPSYSHPSLRLPCSSHYITLLYIIIYIEMVESSPLSSVILIKSIPAQTGRTQLIQPT